MRRDFEWRKNIARFLKTRDFEPFERDFLTLVEMICRKRFQAGKFGFGAWGEQELKEVHQEVLAGAIGRNLIAKLETEFNKFEDRQWNGYFSAIIRNHLLQKLRVKEVPQTELENFAFGQEDQGIRNFEIRNRVQPLIRSLTDRQRKVLRGLCEGKTLETIAVEIGTARKSTIYNEKKAIIEMLRRAELGGQNLKEFTAMLCELLEESVRLDR